MKNKLAEKDQVRMIVRNVSPNLVERLQMMNPKTFIDLYDDGLQAEEMESEKKEEHPKHRSKELPNRGHTTSQYKQSCRSPSRTITQKVLKL